MEICKYCNKEIKDNKSLSAHIGKCANYLIFLSNLENTINKEYLIEEYVNNGKSIKYLTDTLGFKNCRNIKKLLQKFNIQIRTQKQSKKQKHHILLAMETSTKKYGEPFHIAKGIIKDKSNKTLKDKYGVDNIFQVAEIKQQIKENNIEKYGVEYSAQIPEIIEKRKRTNLIKYGYENPWSNKDIIKKCMETKLSKPTNSFYYSKKSQKLFWDIYNKLPGELQKHTYFGELNKEYGKYDNINKCYYFYDFVITNIKYNIEYNGNYYHANPLIYESNFYNKHLKLTAEEIWYKDKIKLNLINDYSIKIVWENTENEDMIKQILQEINNLYKPY